MLVVGPQLNAQIARLIGDDFGEKPEHAWEELNLDDVRSASGTFYCTRCDILECGWENRDELPKGPCVKRPVAYSENIMLAWTARDRVNDMFRSGALPPAKFRDFLHTLKGEAIYTLRASAAALAICEAIVSALT